MGKKNKRVSQDIMIVFCLFFCQIAQSYCARVCFDVMMKQKQQEPKLKLSIVIISTFIFNENKFLEID